MSRVNAFTTIGIPSNKLAHYFYLYFQADIKACSPTKDDGETGCDVDECCIPEMEFFKVSKRDEPVLMKPDIMDLKPVFPWGNRAGECKLYDIALH